MIRKECFTKEWIETVRDRFHYNDVNLIEKVIRAYSLVEMLCMSGCPFIWKGGSSLMLLLGSELHRLSIDVDIICPPGTDIEKFLTKFSEYGFTGRETVEREQRGTSVPKSHEKFHYLATAIEKGASAIQHFNRSSDNPDLLSTVSNKLNKLRGILPEAFFYWTLTSQLLAD